MTSGVLRLYARNRRPVPKWSVSSPRGVFFLVAILTIPFALGDQSAKAEDSRLNVLFLAVDDMRDWVGCLDGYAGKVHTPNIDRLARGATLFRNAHCPSPKCAPSRAAILLGQRASTTGLYDNGHWWLPNRPDTTTLPAHFRNQDYHVVGAGKIFHHTAGNQPPNQWDDFEPIRFRCDPWFRGSKLNYPWSESSSFPSGFPFGKVRGLGHENDWGSLPIADDQYDDEFTASYSIDYLQRPSSRPFFLACGFFRPHLPWYVPAQYFEKYPLDQIVVPASPVDDLDDLPEGGLAMAKSRRSDLSTIENAGKIKHAIRAYLASISYIDAQIGRVLDALESSSEYENTVIVLWSDHGWHLGEKRHWHKSTLWEAATRVPLIIRVPGVRPGVCDRPVSLVDLYPTLIDLCRLPYDDLKLDGVSLVPLLKTPQRKWNRPALIEYQQGNAAVRSERYRYIRYRKGGEELYDHQNDPDELHNVAADPSYSEIKSNLRRWLPEKWSAPAATKKSFDFDPENYRWTEKGTGRIINGK